MGCRRLGENRWDTKTVVMIETPWGCSSKTQSANHILQTSLLGSRCNDQRVRRQPYDGRNCCSLGAREQCCFELWPRG